MSKRKNVGQFDVTLDEGVISSRMSCVEGNNYDVDDHGNLHISGGDEAAVFAADQWAYAKYQPPGDEPDEVMLLAEAVRAARADAWDACVSVGEACGHIGAHDASELEARNPYRTTEEN